MTGVTSRLDYPGLMRVLVAGATGVLGRPLMRVLRDAGHDVAGFSRRAHGEGVHATDALDAAAVNAVVADFRPDAVVNALTAIPPRIDPRHIDRDFALTNRLRSEGTRNLIAAAPEARHLGQSIAFIYDPAPGLATEEDPLWRKPPKAFGPALAAVLELERSTREAGGVVLRLGQLHGPGTAFDAGGSFHAGVGARKIPVVGGGTAVFSFLHTDDAATAFAAALEAEAGTTFNVVEDRSLTVAQWLPDYARELGAKPPRRVPLWLGRLVGGAYGAAFFTRLRGASNARARDALGWAPRHAFLERRGA